MALGKNLATNCLAYSQLFLKDDLRSVVQLVGAKRQVENQSSFSSWDTFVCEVKLFEFINAACSLASFDFINKPI